jgi:hypothetical protein
MCPFLSLQVTLLMLLMANRRDMSLQEAAAYGAPNPSAYHKAVLGRPPGLLALPCCSLMGALQQAAKALGLSKVYINLKARQSALPLLPERVLRPQLTPAHSTFCMTLARATPLAAP